MILELVNFYLWILKNEMKLSRKICQMTEVELSILEPDKILFLVRLDF